MKALFLEHVPFEKPGAILTWMKKRGFDFEEWKIFERNALPPDSKDFDLLVVMGGPMNIYEYEKYPWLKEEKKFIEKSIKKEKKVLGICLGAQLIADVFGSKIYRNRYREIGWFDVTLTPEGRHSPLLKGFPQRFTAFHWHGDTFELPHGSIHLAKSEACYNQAFTCRNQVVALQFHLETTPELMENLIKYSSEDLDPPDLYVQTPEEMRKSAKFEELNKLLDLFLTNFLFPEGGEGR